MSECAICLEDRYIFNKPCPTCKHSCCIECYERIVAANPHAKCSMCRTSYCNPVFNMYVDIAFEDLVLMDLGDALLLELHELKKPQMSRMVEIGAIAALEWIHRVIHQSKEYTITRDGFSLFEFAIMNGQIETMEWLYRNRLWKSKTKRAIDLAIQYNQMESLKWLYENKFIKQTKS